MPPGSLPPEKSAEIEDPEQAIREAIDAEIREPAEDLASTDDAHLIGDNEFRIRALAHRIAAKAIERHPAEKNGYDGFSVTGPHRGGAGGSRGSRSVHAASVRSDGYGGRGVRSILRILQGSEEEVPSMGPVICRVVDELFGLFNYSLTF